MRKKLTTLSLILLVAINGCKKEPALSTNTTVTGKTQTKDAIPAYPFAWETADVMPTPPGTTTILVPWASGSNQQFSPDLAFDFKGSDGWALVYNTFNTTTITYPRFFTLYNKYKGLLRFYCYLDPGTAIPSSYLNHGLNISGSSSSSMLNYIAQDVTNFTVNQTDNTQVLPQQVQATGGWYVTQYEIAYDPNISNITQAGLNMVWKMQSINVSQISLNGTLNGTVKSAASAPKSSFNLAATGQQIGESAVTSVLVNSLKDLDKGAQNSTSTSTSGVGTSGSQTANNKSNFTDKAVGIIESAVSANVAGVVKGVFSLIFGGNSSGSQNVNLTIKANIGLAGTSTSTTALWQPTLVIPGSSGAASATGYVPAYNDVMGVFNLSAQPKIGVVKTYKTVTGGFPTPLDNTTTTYSSFGIDPTSFQVVLNPAVTSIASVTVVKKEIVLFGSFLNQITAQVEQDTKGNPVYTNVNTVTLSYLDNDTENLLVTHQLAVRFTLHVTPNNGAPMSTIIKTFYAQPVVTTVDNRTGN